MKQTTRTVKQTTTSYSVIKSPVGDLLLAADDSALTGVYFAGCDHVPGESKQWTHDPRHPVLQSATKQLAEYFAGKRTAFSVPLRLSGTNFQKKVWQEIARIPYGKTVSYSDLAQRAGAPEAVRAAGTATGRNPLSIIIPCHRVIGKNGSLCGFAGGLERKRYLHKLEGLSLKPVPAPPRAR